MTDAENPLFYVAQSGLTGEGMPNHNEIFTAEKNLINEI